MRRPLLLVALVLAAPTRAQPTEAADLREQPNPAPPTPGDARLAGFDARQDLRARSLLTNVAFRSVAPTVMSGHVTDVDVSPTAPTAFLVAYASGGIWRTISLGAGENSASRSSYAGAGVYKSTDEVRDEQERADDGRVYLKPRTYTVTLSLGDESMTETLTVEPSPEKPVRGRKKTP